MNVFREGGKIKVVHIDAIAHCHEKGVPLDAMANSLVRQLKRQLGDECPGDARTQILKGIRKLA